jgi:hypothetical protein
MVNIGRNPPGMTGFAFLRAKPPIEVGMPTMWRMI